MEHLEFLLAAPALLLPLLIRFLRPPKPQVIAFPQMHVLEQVLKHAPPPRHRSPWLLYLLRMAAAALAIALVLGLRLPVGGLGAGRTAGLIILDDTFYTRVAGPRGQLWEEIRRAAYAELGRLPLGSSAACLGFSGSYDDWSDPGSLTRALGARGPGYAGEDWSAVRGRIRDLLRRRRQQRVEITVLSEGAVADPEGLEQALAGLPEGVSLRFVAVKAEKLPNEVLSARAVTLPDGLMVLGSVARASPGRARLEIRGGGEKLAGEVEVPGNAPAPLRLEFPGKHLDAGEIELMSQDGFDLDNRHYFCRGAGDRFSLVLLDQKSAEQRLKDASYYLTQGLGVLEDRHTLEVQRREPRAWMGFDEARAGAVLLFDPPFLPRAEAAKLAAYARAGGELAIIAGPLVEPEVLEAAFKDALPAALKEIQRTEARLEIPEPWRAALPRLVEAPFRGRWLFYHLKSDAEVKLRFADGVPFWVSAPLGRGHIHLLSSPFHLQWCDAVVLGDFPRALQFFLEILAPDRGRAATLAPRPGQPFPEGLRSVRRLLGSPEPFSGAATPGVYECTAASGAPFTLACNFDPERYKARRPFSGAQLERTLRAGPGAGQGPRLDPWLSLLLAGALLAEVTYLRRKLGLAAHTTS